MTEIVYNKSGIPFDIDAIATDLNGKADVDLTNVNNSGTSVGASWSMPSTSYEDLTLGASGTNYTAPANGYVAIRASSTASFAYTHLAANNLLSTLVFYGNNVNGVGSYLPVKKGDIFNLTYGGVSITFFKFVYAKGSE